MSCLWQGSVAEFIERCQHREAFAQLAAAQHHELHHTPAGDSLVNAWRKSLPALSAALALANLKQAHIAVEYELPLTGLTADAVVFGWNRNGDPTACIVELKQWSEIQRSKDGRFPFWVQGLHQPQRHPLTQVLAYRDYLAQCHSQAGALHFEAAAYMHAMQPDSVSWAALQDKRLLRHAAIFCKGTAPLAKWLQQHVGGAASPDEVEVAFHSFLNGGFRQSQAFLDRMRTLFIEMRLTENASQAVASSAWQLTSNQEHMVHQVMAAVKTGARHAFVVTGEPGSGKTVVALNLIKSAFVEGYSSLYATGNGGLEAVARESMQLWGHQLVKNVRHFRQDVRQSVTDLLVVDESQRLWDSHSEVDALLKRGKVIVYLLDDGQILRSDENGTRAYVQERIEVNGLPYTHLHLNEHFRCGGGPAYIRWVQQLLGFCLAEAPAPNWDRQTYPVAVLPTFESMRKQVQAWTSGDGRAGLVSALTPAARKLVHKPIEVRQQRELTAFYNDRRSNELSQAVSIYSVQGLELDYVGLVWGEDLVRRGSAWVAQPHQSERQLKNADYESALQLLKNRYWVLLTRGVKGLAIHCTDPETSTYLESQLACR